MKIIAIDPGQKKSAVVVLDFLDNTIIDRVILPNEELIERADFGFTHVRTGLHKNHTRELAIETMSPMGMAVGRSIFDTLIWIGRFYEAFEGPRRLIPRTDIKLCMCKSMIANDTTIRQAVIEWFRKSVAKELLGGGKNPLVGTKKNPGPLHGIVRDLWQACAVAITYIDQRDVPF